MVHNVAGYGGALSRLFPTWLCKYDDMSAKTVARESSSLVEMSVYPYVSLTQDVTTYREALVIAVRFERTPHFGGLNH